MNPTFHLFCRISPASPPACRPPAARFRRPLPPPAFAARFRRPLSPPAFAAGFAARFRRPSPPALLRPSRLHPRLRRLFLGRPLRVPASRPCFASLLCVSARRLFPGRPLRVPALRPCPAFRPGPFPRRLLRTLPCPPPLSLPGFRSPPPRPAGPAVPVPSSHGPSGPPSSARRCSRTIPRPCTRRETPLPAVWRSAVSGR